MINPILDLGNFREPLWLGGELLSSSDRLNIVNRWSHSGTFYLCLEHSGHRANFFIRGYLVIDQQIYLIVEGKVIDIDNAPESYHLLSVQSANSVKVMEPRSLLEQYGNANWVFEIERDSMATIFGEFPQWADLRNSC